MFRENDCGMETEENEREKDVRESLLSENFFEHGSSESERKSWKI
jgi:hypothetical protein